MPLENLRYPIGRFDTQQECNEVNKKKWIDTIRKAPALFRAATESLSEAQLDTPYRTDGWTIRQVVHHVVDSHINSYVRFKWTLTEDSPIIKAYDEKTWATLSDSVKAPLNLSLELMTSLHNRWVFVLESMSNEDFKKQLGHPEWKKNLNLGFMLSLYAWHCDHHLAHITELCKRQGW